MGHLEGQGGDRFLEEGPSAVFGFLVLDGEVDPAGGPVDGDVEVTLAPLAIDGLQLGQVLDVHMNEAEIVILEALGRLVRCCGGRGAAAGPGPRS